MTQRTLTYEEMGILPVDVYEAMGYHGTLPDAVTQSETAAIMHHVHSLLSPRFCFRIVRELPAFSMGTIIPRQLHGAEAYACFVCTAGQEYDDYLQQLKKQGDMLRMYLADALGTVIAEKCAERMEHYLQASIDKLGWHRTNRYSPGYCGWHVSQQQLLFSLFDGSTCGVTLTDSSLMVPIKSVSGVIGLGREVRRRDYTCGLCSYKHCYKRKYPTTGTTMQT